MDKTSVEKAVDITCAFEGSRGYTAIAANFDGQGMSFGAFQWNAGQHTLQPILRETLQKIGFEKAQAIFTNDGLYILNKKLENDTAFFQWICTLSVKNPQGRLIIAEPWYTRFVKLALTPECQQVQRAHMQVYIDKAKSIMKSYGFKSERAFVLSMDIAVQNGGVTGRADQEYKSRITPAMNEKSRLYILSQAVANTALPKFQEDVRSRKLCVAMGKGIVHGKPYQLDETHGLTDAPAILT